MDNQMPAGDLSAIISKLMADEKFGEMVESVKTSLSTNAENGDTAPAVEESEPASSTSEDQPPIAGIPKLSPELMAKLPEIMGMLSHGGGKQGNPRLEDRKRLLNALKPFLSENRRNAVDSIVNIAGIADLFGI